MVVVCTSSGRWAVFFTLLQLFLQLQNCSAPAASIVYSPHSV